VSEFAGQIRQICDCYFIWFITTWIKADCRLRHLYGACPKTSAPESCPQTRRNTQMVMGPTSSCPDSNDPIRHATCPTNKKNNSHGDGPDFVMPRLKCSYSSCRLLAHNASGTEKNKGDSVFQSAVPVTGCQSPGHNASGTKKNKDDSIFPLPSLSTGYGENRQNCSATTPSYVGRLGTEPRSASQTLARSLGDK